jgi:hypothetical protein
MRSAAEAVAYARALHALLRWIGICDGNMQEGIFIAATVLGSPMLAVPSVVCALLMNVGALGLIVVARRLVSRANPVRA